MVTYWLGPSARLVVPSLQHKQVPTKTSERYLEHFLVTITCSGYLSLVFVGACLCCNDGTTNLADGPN